MPADARSQSFAVRPGAESGLICAFACGPAGASQPLGVEQVDEALAAGRIVWLHFNASNAGSRRWLARSNLVPEVFLEVVERHEERVRFSGAGDGMLAVIADLAFGEDAEPSEVVALWAYASERLLVTARIHAARSADVLRQRAREHLDAASGTELLADLIEIQVDQVRDWLETAAQQLDHSEDQILIGNVTRQREALGRVRRLAMHLRRHLSLMRNAMHYLLAQPPERRGGIRAERWHTLHEHLSFLMEEAIATHERAKLLLEELASRTAEATSRSLFILTVTTIVFLPMTLISGIFGMNVAGVPGVGESASALAFWLVLGLIAGAGVMTYLLIRLRRLM